MCETINRFTHSFSRDTHTHHSKITVTALTVIYTHITESCRQTIRAGPVLKCPFPLDCHRNSHREKVPDGLRENNNEEPGNTERDMGTEKTRSACAQTPELHA